MADATRFLTIDPQGAMVPFAAVAVDVGRRVQADMAFSPMAKSHWSANIEVISADYAADCLAFLSQDRFR